MYTKFIVTSIVIIVLTAIIAVYVYRDVPPQEKSQIKEVFADQVSSLVPKAIEALNVYCGRNLVFPNMNDNHFLASSRAVAQGDDLSSGCALKRQQLGQDENSAIIHEDYMYYTLRRSCVMLSISSFTFKKDGSIVIYVDRSTPDKIRQLAALVFYNPLFLEFSKGTSQTVAYYPDFSVISNLSSNESAFPFAITLYPLVNKQFFEYNLYKEYTRLEKIVVAKQPLATTVYYLDESADSSQNVGRYQSIARSSSGYAKIFDKQFETTKSNNEYHFCNFINIFHTYNVPPVFTLGMQLEFDSSNVSFKWSRLNDETDRLFASRIFKDFLATDPDLNDPDHKKVLQSIEFAVKGKNNITKEELASVRKIILTNTNLKSSATQYVTINGGLPNDVTLARMYMGSPDNNMLAFKTCTDFPLIMSQLSQGPTNNNMFSLVASPSKTSPETHFVLSLVIGSSQNCAGSDSVSIEVPYVSNNVNIIFTATPTEKILTAFWNYSNLTSSDFVTSRKRDCKNQNNFYNLFVGKNRENPKIVIDDINLYYNTNYVVGFNDIYLGYRNIKSNVLME